MSVSKDHLSVTHADADEPVGNNGESLVVAEAARARFQKRQHSLTVAESLKESWKPLLWCKCHNTIIILLLHV